MRTRVRPGAVGSTTNRWGNGWTSSYASLSFAPTGLTPTTNVYDAATNHSSVNSFAAWDTAGRESAIGGYQFAYDAENRMKSATLNVTTVYQYDGDGRRVAKINCPSGTNTCSAATTGASTVWYAYDAQDNLAAEYGQSSAA